MMNINKPLVIVGISAFAEIAYEYFTHDSNYEVVAFSVEKDYRDIDEKFGIPVVDFETLPDYCDPKDYSVFVAATYTQLNRLRTRLANQAKAWGYSLASYVSRRAYIWGNVEIGEHCFIFEDNTLQPFVTVGNNVVLWSGNHIGHHSTIRDNCFIASHAVISGFVTIGKNCFIGVNATLINNIDIASDTWVGPQVLITKNTEAGSFYKPNTTDAAKITTWRYFKVEK